MSLKQYWKPNSRLVNSLITPKLYLPYGWNYGILTAICLILLDLPNMWCKHWTIWPINHIQF